MPRAGIVIDNWKLPIFERRLTGAGYSYEKFPAFTEATTLLKVKTENVDALHQVLIDAQTEAGNGGGTNVH